MGIFSKSDFSSDPKEQYGASNDAAYAEMFGEGGITPDGSLSEEEREDNLFFESLDYAALPENNYLSNIQRGTLTREAFFDEMRRYLRQKDEDEAVVDKILSRLETYIWGYYIIEDAINDPDVSDIKILSDSNIRLKKKGKRMNSNERFHDVADYERFVRIICARNKVQLSDINAILKFTDRKSNENAILRFNITSQYINSSDMPVVHIRKIPKEKRDLTNLARLGVFPEELIPYLKYKAKSASGIILTGKGASGKTTVMNSLLDEIPHDKSGCIIQESDELFSEHPDMMFQHVVSNRGEGKIKYELKDLATNGLLTDLDYFIIGEIKGEEAATFMDAAYTGHQCWTSVHGTSSTEAVNKLADYVARGTNYSLKEAYRMLRFMNCIIFMKDFSIMEISEIVGFDEEKGVPIYDTVYKKNEFCHVSIPEEEDR